MLAGLMSVRPVRDPRIKRIKPKQQMLTLTKPKTKIKLAQANTFQVITLVQMKRVKLMKTKLEMMARQKNIKIITWNANGILHKKNELEELLYRERIDICLVTETKLNYKKNISFINYNCYREDRIADNAGGGVLILVNKKFNNSEKLVNANMINIVGSIEYIAIKLNRTTYIAVYNALQ